MHTPLLKKIAGAILTGTLLLPTTGLSGTKIYVLAGQSNMMGKGKAALLPPAYRKTPHNVTFIYQGRQKKLAQYSFFGPEVSFAHEVARAFPQDKHILIKYAATGSSIQQWLPEQALYKGLLRQIGFSHIRKHGGGDKTAKNREAVKKVSAIFWMQGETDARDKARATPYSGYLNRFIHSLRQDLNSPNSLFIFGQINPESKAFPMVKQIQQSQQHINRNVSNTILTMSDGLGKLNDKIHYNAAGQIELGRRFAQAYIKQERRRASFRAQNQADHYIKPSN